MVDSLSKMVLLDANFLVGLFKPDDQFHKESRFLFKLLWGERRRIRIIIPPLCIYEVIIVLKRAGVDSGTIQSKIMTLMTMDSIIVQTVNEMSAFRHSNGPIADEPIKTNDFIIASTGLDYNALIFTFDERLRNRVKPLYAHIYYCERSHEMNDSIEALFAEE